LTEVIHFGNYYHPSVASLRLLHTFARNAWRLSIGILVWKADTASCIAVNVSGSDKHVKVELIDVGSAHVIASSSGLSPTGPGVHAYVSVSSLLPMKAYCKFIVLDEGATKVSVEAY
jgi:hypothetical protein